MLASGLVGWGIAYARLEKRYLRFLGMIILGMLLHAAWNAGAVFSTSRAESASCLSMPGFDFLGAFM